MQANFNVHEYLTYSLINDLFDYHPLNEERGRIPFISKILSEIEEQILAKCNWKNQTNKFSLIYKPSFNTFFNQLTLTTVSITILPEYSNIEDKANGGYNNKTITWVRQKIDNVDLFCNIQCPVSRLSYNIQRTIGHELLHAYEAYKRNFIKKPFDTPKQSDFYRDIKILMDKGNPPQIVFAYLFYFNNPHELRAHSQGIQSGYNAIASNISYNFHDLPFNMLKNKIQEYKDFKQMKENLDWVYKNYSESDLLIAMNTILDKPITTINQLNKIVNYQLANIEQIYDKALSRAIEHAAINELYKDYGPKSISTTQSIRKTMNEIYKKYGHPSNIKQ